MTEIELKYADHCINKLYERYNEIINLDNEYDFESMTDQQRYIVHSILADENWLEKTQYREMYKLQSCALPIIKKYGSYSNYYWNDEKIKNRKEQKEIFDFHISKWKYHTFWWFFGLAIFGGGYSVYDIIERIVMTNTNIKEQISTKESEEFQSDKQSIQNTSFLHRKNLDSLHSAKTHVDTLNVE